MLDLHPRPRPFPNEIAGFICGAGTWGRMNQRLGRHVFLLSVAGLLVGLGTMLYDAYLPGVVFWVGVVVSVLALAVMLVDTVRTGQPAKPAWYEHGSDFASAMMRRYGVFRIDRNGDISTPDPPLWDGALEGTTLHILKSKLQGVTPFEKWRVPRVNVVRALLRVAGNVRWILVFAHSHFGQVVTMALCDPALRPIAHKIIFVTIDTPNRRGRIMQSYYEGAARAIGRRWIHVHSGAGWGSRMRWLGARCLPWQRQTIEHARFNIAVPRSEGHSGIITMGPEDMITWDRVMVAAAQMAKEAA